MRVAVTGGSGRVGQVTVAGLMAAGHEVLVLDQVPPPADSATGIEFLQVEAHDYDALLQACRGVSSIVHLAGIPGPLSLPAQVIHNTNVAASYNVLCAAVELGLTRIVMASSVNAIGSTWSRAPRFDYFPVDRHHRTRNDDPYSLSKWIGECQADSIVSRHPQLSVASLRLHMFMRDRAEAIVVNAAEPAASTTRGLWGYTTHRMWMDACLGALTAEFSGHEVFYVVSDRTVSELDSAELAAAHYPGAEIRRPLFGHRGFFDCGPAERLLGWSGQD